MTAAAVQRVGLVVVSHSDMLANGVAELAAQMAPDVTVAPVGGTEEGGLGTDYGAVVEALADADSGSGVVVLYDLGSAKMTAEMAVESADDPSRYAVVDAPLVEGAVAAAVTAQGGASLADVAAAAEGASGEAPVMAPSRPALHLVPDAVSADVLLTNEVGLHARPAALLSRTVAELDADVVVRYGDEEANAASVLGLMGLSAPGGKSITVTATGRDAREAVRRIEELAERGFDD
ncbi:dihydroxyacetone kinase phosphoryl donor subunit DhaM [Nocardia sp. NRRL S-836]|uniref:dihydroxyacetone kinase phosphoryl donor subunit DhaM n=1 Tax=Nocardia sp. NRRL S-836 TaxID=1519492 RepID=UPI0006B050B3|nr:dihydroxyacetone kinase phosphoryl donor subunit DhaM [Nocardia sp. NRRL S-836]KOV78875.1 PTS sugar transporter subunit IIA [Nocardia sp. NRRL S-836]